MGAKKKLVGVFASSRRCSVVALVFGVCLCACVVESLCRSCVGVGVGVCARVRLVPLCVRTRFVFVLVCVGVGVGVSRVRLCVGVGARVGAWVLVCSCVCWCVWVCVVLVVRAVLRPSFMHSSRYVMRLGACVDARVGDCGCWCVRVCLVCARVRLCVSFGACVGVGVCVGMCMLRACPVCIAPNVFRASACWTKCQVKVVGLRCMALCACVC